MVSTIFVPIGSYAQGFTVYIKDLHLPEGVTLGGLIRDKVGMPINGSTHVQPGDSVVVFAIDGLIKKMDQFFRKPEKGLVSKLIDKLS